MCPFGKECMKVYSIGQFISYGNSGVCEVVGTSELESSKPGHEKKQCYILRPLHDRTCTITTPVDNDKVIMRSLISPEETRQLLADIPEIETLPDQSARQQELSYQRALHSGDCKQWICLVKTLDHRIRSRKAKGKKVTATDDRYFKAVTQKLTEEFSVVLGMNAEQTIELLKGAFTESQEG